MRLPYGIRVVMVIVFSMGLYGNAFSAGAGQQATVSIDEAVRIALANNQDYAIAKLKRAEAKEKVRGAWGQLMPALESEASAARQYAENGFLSLSDGQYDIKFVQLRFGINPGIFYNTLESSRRAYTAAEEDQRRVKAEVEFTVIQGYFSVLLAGEMAALRRESLDLLKSNLRDVENLYRTGSVPKFELLQAQVQYKSQEPLVLEAESNYRIALDTFNFTLGVDTVSYIPDTAVLNTVAFDAPGGDMQANAERIARIALKNRPEILQLERKREMLENSKHANSAYYIWPTFSVGGYYGMTKYMPNQIDVGLPAGPMTPDFSQISGNDSWQTTWQVRVAATYRWGSLIPADPVRAAERADEQRIREAAEELSKLRRLVAISIRADYSRFVTAALTIKSRRENVATAEEGLRIARESYRAGVIKNSELLSAEVALTNSRTAYINAIHSYYVSRAGLKKDAGVDDIRSIMEDGK